MLVAALHATTRVPFSWTPVEIHPSTVIGILAAAALYIWRARAGLREKTDGARDRLTGGHIAFFTAGLLSLILTLNGPLHDLGDGYLFGAHMVQHLLLTMLVPPLLIAGIPGWMLRPTLRVRWVRAVARRVSTGPAAFTLFNVTFVAWHVPVLYDAALVHHPLHIVEHLCFLVTATIMWWPLMSTLPELPRLSYPQQMLYTFLMMLPMSVVSIILTYADAPLYPFYAAAPRTFGLSPMTDQLIGGLIMWIPGGLIFVGVLTVVFFRWAASEEDGAAAAQVHWHPSAAPATK